MNDFILGHQIESGQPIRVPRSSFDTHWHIIGGTGKGKTVCVTTILHALFNDPANKNCFFIIDRMGGFSFDLLRYFAIAPSFIQDRLVYIEPARPDTILGFNPFEHTTIDHAYFKVSRATEIILRAWESVNIEAMPRLARWVFNAFMAAALLGLNLADCFHFLMPTSALHEPLMQCLPDNLRSEWSDIYRSGPSQVAQTLDSTRNRLKPYWEWPILQRMFSVTTNRLDVVHLMQEGKIVLINLAPMNHLSEQIADSLGGLFLNEVFSAARSLPMDVIFPTYVVLDEFQRFVGPDVEAAIPEVRQLGIKLLLSHQSFSQLERGQYDLSSLIWQCQSRMMFGVQGEDADILAHEIASLTFDKMKIKDEIFHKKQMVTGHSIIELASRSDTQQATNNWMHQYGNALSQQHNIVERDQSTIRVRGKGDSSAKSQSSGTGGATSESHTTGVSQSVIPVYEKYTELANRTYETFEEQKSEWAKQIRLQKTAEAFLRLVNDPTLYPIRVRRSAPLHLSFPWHKVKKQMPQVAEKVDELIEKNFAQPYFVTHDVVERETQERLRRILQPRITITSDDAPPEPDANPLA